MNEANQKALRLRLLVGATLLSSLGGACASEEIRPSGFLESYEGLEASAGGNLVWSDPEMDLARYSSVQLESVEVWLNEETHHRGVSWPNLRQYAQTFEASVRQALGDAYPIVDEPGPGTMLLRMAITDVRLDIDGYTTRENLGYGDPEGSAEERRESTLLDVSEVGIEAEARDSLSGRTIWRLVARQSEGSVDDEGAVEWTFVNHVFDTWAQALRTALDAAHTGS